MITVYPESGKPLWIDLRDPTPEEIAKACSDYGLDIPPRNALEEIEFSSRLQYEDGTFTLSVPVTPHDRNGDGQRDEVTTPLGFVLIQDLLVTQMGGLSAAEPGGAAAAAPAQNLTMSRPGRLYAAADDTSAAVRQLSPGMALYPTGQANGVWIEVSDEVGNKGWVPRAAVENAK